MRTQVPRRNPHYGLQHDYIFLAICCHPEMSILYRLICVFDMMFGKNHTNVQEKGIHFFFSFWKKRTLQESKVQTTCLDEGNQGKLNRRKQNLYGSSGFIVMCLKHSLQIFFDFNIILFQTQNLTESPDQKWWRRKVSFSVTV